MSNLNRFINKIIDIDYKFIDEELKKNINKCIITFLPNLNNIDRNIINILTLYIIDLISYKYNFKKNNDYYYQWIQNNYRDLKSIILLLLPFIDDKEKDDGFLLNKIIDLNQLLYSNLNQNISNKILLLERTEGSAFT
jgi:hypothetical protein